MLKFDVPKRSSKLRVISKSQYVPWLKKQSDARKAWLKRAKFKADANTFVSLPDRDGKFEFVLAGAGETFSQESIGSLPKRLPQEDYRLEIYPRDGDFYELLLGWELGSYDYKAEIGLKKPRATSLVVSENYKNVLDEANSISLSRTLVTTPASHMLPDHLERTFLEVAHSHDAEIEVVKGSALLKRKFTTIHTVGRASASEPRLLHMTWGNPKHKKLALLGKGVCFDSGGLDLKTAAQMRSMKKDMGGAAIALGLADLIMRRKLPLYLDLYIPAVENAVSSNAYRPGDVIQTYLGKTVEIGNTDAEGRLILCDALAYANEKKPDLMIDFATLTGAARSAVGTEIAAVFSTSDHHSQKLEEAGKATNDPVARLPLHQGYRPLLSSPVADICNIASESTGGAITAALFLQEFTGDTPWIHFDVNAWNPRERPAHPTGGEAMGLRATFAFLEKFVGAK